MSATASHPLYVAVEGPIGVGKTTLVRALSKRMGARLVLEEFEENPFLALFYTNRDQYAFQTQIFFLMSRFKQQTELLQPDLFQPHLLSDYHLLKDRIFAGLTLSQHELSLYESVYRALESQILKPDVMVYLRASQAALLDRIDRRGREYEKDFDRGYLLDLSQAYQDHFRTYTATPLVEIDTTDVNVPQDPDAVDEIVDRIITAV